MFILNMDGHADVSAEFVVPSALMALDLALNATRAGIPWSAAAFAEELRPLSLPMLWQLAEEAATEGPPGAAYLEEILRVERAHAGARRN